MQTEAQVGLSSFFFRFSYFQCIMLLRTTLFFCFFIHECEFDQLHCHFANHEQFISFNCGRNRVKPVIQCGLGLFFYPNPMWELCYYAKVKVLPVKLICAKLLWTNELMWAWLTEFSLHSVASLWQKPFCTWFFCCNVLLENLRVLPSPCNCSTCKLWSYDYPSYIYGFLGSVVITDKQTVITEKAVTTALLNFWFI